jgi:hypothetical protein
MSASGRTGVMLMRVWVEESASSMLRVRITHMLDTASTRQEVVTASGIDEVCAFVRGWLEAFTAVSDDPGTDI